jgi:hypothetical protein
MKKQLYLFLITCALIVTACGNQENIQATPTEIFVPEITATPDLCIEPALSVEIGKVNNLMREFDDYSTLASNTPQTQLVIVIPELQRILRNAEDQVVPACLLNLKRLQLQHMEVVVQTLLSFMGETINVDLVNQGIAQARDLHLQYDVEMARLLGITLQPQPTP